MRPDTLFDYIYRLSLQDHGLAFSKDKCAKGMPKHRALSGSSGPVTPARREAAASTPKSARKSASRPRKSTYKEESSPKSTRRTAARPLAVPTRTRHVALGVALSSRADASLYTGPAYQMYHAQHVR